MSIPLAFEKHSFFERSARADRGGFKFASASPSTRVRCDGMPGFWNFSWGPGLLAERILERCPNLSSYTLLDSSPYMLAASRERLARFPLAHFVSASFKSEDWVESVAGPFDCIVSMQAVHELRHQRHAPQLYRQVHRVTAPLGQLLICDHLPLDDTARA